MNIALTKDGYLQDINDWTPEIAKWLAKGQNLSLTDNHWEIINYLRDSYNVYKKSLPIRALVKAVKQEFGEDKGNSIYLHKLFPENPAKQATLIAGLPKPINCI